MKRVENRLAQGLGTAVLMMFFGLSLWPLGWVLAHVSDLIGTAPGGRR